MGLEFKIDGVTYPPPEQYRLGDCLLVKDLTGLDFGEYAAQLEKGVNQTCMIGMVGVAVWQKHPNWSRPDVVTFIEQIDMADFEVPGGDGSPPVEEPEAEETPSPGTSDESTTSPEPSETAALV